MTLPREIRWVERVWSEVRLPLRYLDVSRLPASNGSDKKVWMDEDDKDLSDDGYTPPTGRC